MPMNSSFADKATLLQIKWMKKINRPFADSMRIYFFLPPISIIFQYCFSIICVYMIIGHSLFVAYADKCRPLGINYF